MQQQAPWLIADRYEVGDVVGRGGYGMVCRGMDRKTGRTVALKMLSPEAGRDPDVVERMLREQQALVALSGTCVVSAIDLCKLESGAPCLVMEWLEGRDLEQQLSDWEAAGQRGAHDELLRLLQPVTETLQRAHDIGIVHRDIKPANIFVTRGQAPGARLLDFGLASMRSAAPLTEAGMVMGSPSYIAPETWRGDATALDGRADLYSLAVIVFRWLTGQLPFQAPDLIGKMTQVTTGPRPSVRALRPDLPATIDAWMTRGLAIEPRQRFQSGREFHAGLTAALNGEELPRASADTSGVRAILKTPLGPNPLTTAFRAAASLLKRFSSSKPSMPSAPAEAPPPPSPEADAPAPESSAGDRVSIWLDSDELEDVRPEPPPPLPRARDAPAEAEPGSSTAPRKAKGEGKRKGKGKKAKGKPAKKAKRKKAAERKRGKSSR